MISQKQARKITLAQSFDWGTTTIPLEASFGRVLREDIFPDRPQPPFDRVTMDGICINYATYASGQRFYPIERLQPAGSPPHPLQDPSSCIEIMTGAALPAGTNTVIRYEDLQPQTGGFLLPDGIIDGKNIHTAGSDLSPDGGPAIKSGRLIGVAEIGLLATFGKTHIKVSSLPRVAVVSTGNELIKVKTSSPRKHQIRRSNVHQLSSLIAAKGISVSNHHLADDEHQMRLVIQQLLQDHDILIFSGGVSKGKLDFIPGVLKSLGVKKLFHGVAQRPGKPLWVGRTEKNMVFGLPGNPVSSLACLLLYVGPFIKTNLGLPVIDPRRVSLGKAYAFKPELNLALSVSLETDGFSYQQTAMPVESQGSGDASSLLRTNGFLLLPNSRELFEAGRRYPYLPLNELY